MKRYFLFFILLAAVSCGPSRYVIPVEMRHPSSAGVELSGKVISVVCLENDDAEDSMKCQALAEGFASALESSYVTPNDTVEVYRMRVNDGTDYASRDVLVGLLMDTGADFVFLFDTLGTDRLALHCYDAMDKEDKVHTYTAALESENPDMSALGQKIAASFKPQWKTEQYSIVYFEGSRWYEALVKAEQMDWKGAIDLWIGLLKSSDPLKRSCAEYNIAVACYMLGENKLASEWLDRSDAECELSLSSGLRKRL